MEDKYVYVLWGGWADDGAIENIDPIVFSSFRDAVQEMKKNIADELEVRFGTPEPVSESGYVIETNLYDNTVNDFEPYWILYKEGFAGEDFIEFNITRCKLR